MKKLIVSLLAVAGLVACSNEDVVRQQAGETIGFSGAFVENATRAKAEDPSIKTTTLDAFRVWAFMDEVSGEVLNDELVSKEGSLWSYANVQYWMPGHTYYFAALAPVEGNWTLNTANANTYGAGIVDFINADGSEDLLYAATSVESVLNGNKAVKFQFNHLLSKIKFTFENGFATDNITVDVKNVTMTAPKSGSINLAVENWWDNDDWKLTEETFVLEFGDVETLKAGASDEAAKERLTIPASAEREYVVNFDAIVYSGNIPTEFHKTATIKGAAFEMGKAYNLKATISPENLDLEAIEFEIEVKEWDQTSVNGDYYIDVIDNTIHVSNVNGLQVVAEKINAGLIANDVTIVLDGDIDLAATRSINTNFSPIGTEDIPFEGVFDGRGFAIKNFNYVADESVYFVGLFGCAQNATIKNLIVENAYVEFASAANGVGGTIGVVVGGLYGNSTLENITVKGDVKVVGELDKAGAGRIGAVVGGNEGTNKVVVKNVRVEANAGSFVHGNNAIGGISGQLQGTATFVDCYSNIDVIAGQYFAGGIEGLSAATSTFTNCHSAGNVSVVAGRAGNANDLYRVGGIVGGWADGNGKTLVLADCSFAGVVAGKDAAGVVAETLDCAGFVGRGYAAAAGSKVSVNGIVYTYNGNGVYQSEGAFVSNADELTAALNNSSIKTIVLNEGEFGVIVAKSNKTIIASANAKVDAVVFNGSENVTLKNIVFDAAKAIMGYDGSGKAKMSANIMNDNNGGKNTPAKGASNIVIENCSFVGTFANGGASIAFTDQSRSGGFTGNVAIKGCTFATANGYYDIYGHYCGNGLNGMGDFAIENCTFNSTRTQGMTVYLGRYASSTPVVVKGNAFNNDANLAAAVYVQDHSNYGVSIAAENNTFAN